MLTSLILYGIAESAIEDELLDEATHPGSRFVGPLLLR